MVPEARTKPALRGWAGARSTLKVSRWSESSAALACTGVTYIPSYANIALDAAMIAMRKRHAQRLCLASHTRRVTGKADSVFASVQLSIGFAQQAC